MKYSFQQVLSIMAIFQSLLLSFYFFRLKEGDKSLNLILSSFLTCFAILMTVTFLLTDECMFFFIPCNKMIYILRQCAFLIGPLLYYFVIFSIIPNYRLKIQDSFHLLPFLISVLYFLLKMPYFLHARIGGTGFWIRSQIITFIHILIYSMISFYLIKKSNLKKQFSINGFSNQRIFLMLLIICGSMSVWIIELNIFIVLKLLRFFDFYPFKVSQYPILTFLFINYVVYLILKNSEIFSGRKKYQHSRLDSKQMKIFKDKILHHFKIEKPYLDSSLTLVELAKKMTIPHRLLSQIINEAFHQNFYDFVNFYRVESSKQLLKNPSFNNKTVLEICYDVGFNSKSAFNKAFKKYTGITPSEFRNNNHCTMA